MQRLFAVAFLITSGAVISAYAQGGRIQHKQPTYRGKPISSYLTEAQHPKSRAQALRSIGSFGPEGNSALSQLVSGLKDSDPEVRIAAAWAISQLGPNSNPPTVKALEQALSDHDARVRALAAVALRESGPGAADAIPKLIEALNDPVAFVRAPAADALGAMGAVAHGAVGPLAARLMVKDEQAFVMRSICYALGKIGSDGALPALEEAIKIVRVSYAAEWAILKIKNLPIPSY